MRTITAVLLGCLLLGLLGVAAGCGESEEEQQGEEITGALGGEGGEDSERLSEVLQTLGPVPEVDIQIAEAFSQADAEAAQKNIDRLRDIGEEARTQAGEFEGAQLRDFMTEYATGVVRVADASDRTLEGINSPEAPQLIENLTREKRALQKLDGRFVETLRDVLPPEEFEKVNERMQRLNERFEDAAGGP
jgi:hypothetical protein